MARTAISVVPITAGGYNLTDSAGFSTLATGADNGVTFTFDPTDVLILKNDTGGAAVFTIKVPTPGDYSGITTVADETVSVATAKTWVYQLTKVFKQDDGKVYVDCDVAGKVLVLSPAG